MPSRGRRAYGRSQHRNIDATPQTVYGAPYRESALSQCHQRLRDGRRHGYVPAGRGSVRGKTRPPGRWAAGPHRPAARDTAHTPWLHRRRGTRRLARGSAAAGGTMRLSIRRMAPVGEESPYRTRRRLPRLTVRQRGLAAGAAVALAAGIVTVVASQPAGAVTVGAGSYTTTPVGPLPEGCGQIATNPPQWVTANAPAGATPTVDGGITTPTLDGNGDSS